MIDTKGLIKDEVPYYVGRLQRYNGGIGSGHRYKLAFVYIYFKNGVCIRKRYEKIMEPYEPDSKYYSEVNSKRLELLKQKNEEIKALSEKIGYSIGDISRAIRASTTASSKNYISYNKLLECLTDKDILEREWMSFCLRNYTYNKTVAPEIARRVGVINQPSFGRFPENNNKDTFDYIHLEAGIYGLDIDKKKYCKEHINEIVNAVVDYLSRNKRFLKYGIDVNFLRVTDLVYKTDDVLHFCFELKDISKSASTSQEKAAV